MTRYGELFWLDFITGESRFVFIMMNQSLLFLSSSSINISINFYGLTLEPLSKKGEATTLLLNEGQVHVAASCPEDPTSSSQPIRH